MAFPRILWMQGLRLHHNLRSRYFDLMPESRNSYNDTVHMRTSHISVHKFELRPNKYRGHVAGVLNKLILAIGKAKRPKCRQAK